MNVNYSTQNGLLLKNLIDYYNKDKIDRILPIINGESTLSLRLVDWFVCNYAKKNYTIYTYSKDNTKVRFKVWVDYKLKLKAYSKKRFDPFCRWDRINVPYDKDSCIQTTIGQLNFFKWALENKIIDYIEKNLKKISDDMNSRNTLSRKKTKPIINTNTTRKKREEISISATKKIKKEKIEITVEFK
tara:strand:- start:3642 stop:4202 length:561 start_codon:yes stop_codon:yes gene_type:complete